MDISLEIKVFEETRVVDFIGDAIEFINEVIRKWFASEDQNPLQVTISKIHGRAPPALGISVGEAVPIKDRLV
jgi:hypothetical protein